MSQHAGQVIYSKYALSPYVDLFCAFANYNMTCVWRRGSKEIWAAGTKNAGQGLSCDCSKAVLGETNQNSLKIVNLVDPLNSTVACTYEDSSMQATQKTAAAVCTRICSTMHVWHVLTKGCCCCTACRRSLNTYGTNQNNTQTPRSTGHKGFWICKLGSCTKYWSLPSSKT